MHPMLRLTICSGIAGFIIAAAMPLVPKQFRKVILAMNLVVMSYLTLFRGGHAVRQISVVPFQSYQKWHAADVRWQIYMNYFLFVPYGAILKSMDVMRAILIAALTSAAIEMIQYIFCLGMCEIDDVINNTFGAIAGCLVYLAAERVLQKFRTYSKKSASSKRRGTREFQPSEE